MFQLAQKPNFRMLNRVPGSREPIRFNQARGVVVCAFGVPGQVAPHQQLQRRRQQEGRLARQAAPGLELILKPHSLVHIRLSLVPGTPSKASWDHGHLKPF